MNFPKIRTLIVDDEEIARSGLRHVLEQHGDIAIVGEAASGPAALEAIRSLRPDLVFLDIQMPVLSGIELLEQLPAPERPLVIFVTAYDQFALRAFDLRAIHYLTKPYTNQRMEDALARARAIVRSRDHDAIARQLDRISDLFQRQAARPAEASDPGSRLMVKVNGDLNFVDPASIVWIEGQADYVRLHCVERTLLVRETLTQMEKRLADRDFLRVHKSFVVNLAHVVRLRSIDYGDHSLELDNGDEVRIGRVYRDRLNATLRARH